MLRLLLTYFGLIVIPNITRLFTAELLIAIGAAVLYSYGDVTAGLGGRNLLLGDFVQHAVTISGIALGACLTAVTMAVRLGDAEFAEYLATEAKESNNVDFELVLFELSWTALIVLLTTVIGTVVLLFGPTDTGMFEASMPSNWRFTTALLIGLSLYGVMLLFGTILAISVLGVQRFRWQCDRDYTNND